MIIDLKLFSSFLQDLFDNELYLFNTDCVMKKEQAQQIVNQIAQLRNKARKLYITPTSSDPYLHGPESEELFTQANDLEARVFFYLNPKEWAIWKDDQQTIEWMKENGAYFPSL